MIRALAAWLLLATPVWATQDGWPALYDVAGVAADDVLNIRTAPGADAEIIGTLAPDATDIEVIRDNDGRGTWGLVNSGEGAGWVSLAYMARHPGQWDGQFPKVRQCFGTEPFWSMRFDEPRATFTTPDREARDGLVSGLFRAKGRRDRFAYDGSFFPDSAGELDFLATLRTEACSDGMSDRAFGISVDLFLSGGSGPEQNGLYSGCCSIAPPAE